MSQRRYSVHAKLVTLACLCVAAAALPFATLHADDWLPIPPEDLALKDNPAQPGTDAMILYRRSHVDAKRAAIDGEFDEEYIRTKIFTQRGVDEESDVKLYLLKGESDIKDIRARTIKPDGSIVNFDGQVLDKVVSGSRDARYVEKTFTLPQVQPGCIIEYKYRIEYKPDYVHAQSWTVTEHLFTREAEFSIVPYPARSNMDPTLVFRTTGLPPGSLPQHQGNGSYVMQVHNMLGVKEEPLMPPPSTLEARVEFFYLDAGQPANETSDQFWGRIGKSWSDDVDRYTNKKGALQQAVAQTVAPGDTPEQKLRKLYNRAQKIQNSNYQDEKSAAERKAENIKPNENVEDVLKRNYATGGQINWLFIGLARTAGFEADAVYVAPRSANLFLPNGHSTASLRDDLVWVRAGDKEYWLDPGSRYFPFGLLPWQETESKGIRVSKAGSAFVTTPATPSGSATIQRTLDLRLKDDGSADGKFQMSYNDVAGAEQRGWWHESDEEGRKKQLQEELAAFLPKDATVEVATVTDYDDTSKPLRVEGTLQLPTYASAVGHRILVPASPFVTSYAHVFQAERRVNAVRFDQRYEEIDDTTIHAPSGFKVEALPSAKVNKTGTSFTYEITPSQKGDAIEIKRHFVISDINFPRDSYAALRGYFSNIKSLDEAQIVLASQ